MMLMNALEAYTLEPPYRTPLFMMQDGNAIKYEGVQRSGSVKYRMVQRKLREAIVDEEVLPGSTLIELSAGSTGVALAEAGAMIGHPVEIHMYENADPKKIEKIKSHGAKIISYSLDTAITDIMSIVERKGQLQDYWHLNQMHRDSIVSAYEEIAREILEDRTSPIDRFVCPVGTGGLIQGVGRILKQEFPRIEVVALEPFRGEKIDGIRNTEEVYMGESDSYDRSFPNLRMEVPSVSEAVSVVGVTLGESASATWNLIQQQKWKNTLMIAADGHERV